MANSSEDLLICTCSMPSDVPFFRMLARSIDMYVDPSVKHIVIVPGAAIKVFKEFENERRLVVAQEDVLKFKLYKTPEILSLLRFIRKSFRRPVYFDSEFNLMRGWVVQQILKIEISRRAKERAIMHVDSDVCFVRPFEAHEAFSDGKPILFRVAKDVGSDRIRAWHVNAANLLGLDPNKVPSSLYVNNCIVWDARVCADMVKRVEQVKGRPIHECLAKLPTFSEYVLYGVFAVEVEACAHVAVSETPPCFSFWNGFPEGETAAEIVAKMKPEHAAVALQSTDTVSSRQREQFFKSIECELRRSLAKLA